MVDSMQMRCECQTAMKLAAANAGNASASWGNSPVRLSWNLPRIDGQSSTMAQH